MKTNSKQLCIILSAAALAMQAGSAFAGNPGFYASSANGKGVIDFGDGVQGTNSCVDILNAANADITAHTHTPPQPSDYSPALQNWIVCTAQNAMYDCLRAQGGFAPADTNCGTRPAH